MSDFFVMGGYWPFVWPAWALGLGVLGGLYGFSLVQTRRLDRRLASLRPAERP